MILELQKNKNMVVIFFVKKICYVVAREKEALNKFITTIQNLKSKGLSTNEIVSICNFTEEEINGFIIEF